MESIINRTFGLTYIADPQKSFFGNVFGFDFIVVFLPSRVCQFLQRDESGKLSLLMIAGWNSAPEGSEKTITLTFNSNSFKFYYHLYEYKGDWYFEMELDGNQYTFREIILQK